MNRDDFQALFHHCLLHLTRVKEMGVKTNAKPAFKNNYNTNTLNVNMINDYPTEPP